MDLPHRELAILAGVVVLVTCLLLLKARKEIEALKTRCLEIDKLKSKSQAHKMRVAQLEAKYLKIIDIDSRVQEQKDLHKKIESDIEIVRASYKEKRSMLEALLKEAAIYNEDIELAELGFYKPHFDFDTSEKFKEEITATKSLQRELVSDKAAVTCDAEWVVEGSKSKGQAMTNQGIRLTARAFNNECDAAMLSVRWNNVERMELRIEKAFTAINKLNESNKIYISSKYLDLKLKELRLTHEYADKKQKEKEVQAEIKRQMREEAQLLKEVDKALKEEDKYNKLLEKALLEAETAAGEKLQRLNETIGSLTTELEEAQAKSERAKSMAEQTRIGHVYVISNMGSFGENIYKIGMTRRLEPLDRVKELGDASVPFIFDVHAMIYSEDAPALESALHRAFDPKRLNLVNSRKEFFGVSLEDIESEVHKISSEAEFTIVAEARDYRETLSIRAVNEKTKLKQDLINRLPVSI
jgi:hypothetical protein